MTDAPPPASALAENREDSSETILEAAHLKSTSISGVAVNMGSQGVRLVLQFVYQIVIARLLAPRDFGLVAMSAPVIAFVQVFADLGLSQATIQRPSISQSQLSFLFWINVAVGVGLALVTTALSPAVGWFYGDARAVGITVASGSLFVLGGLYTQHIALLNRRLNFVHLAAIDLTAFACGGAASLTAALLGAGYWAIILNAAVTSVVSLAMAWTFARWIPSRPAVCEDARALLRSGGDVTGFNVLNFFSRNMDNILIGRFAGARNLGLYDRAYKLCLLPFNQISYPFSRVATPLLSRTLNDPRLYRSAYRRLLEANMMLAYPAIVFALVMIDQLVLYGLGAKWTGVAPIFSILALDAFTAPVANSFGWLYVSQGRTRLMRNLGAISSIFFVAAFAAGLRWGAIGVATGYVGAGALEVLILLLLVTRSGPVNLLTVIDAGWRCALAAVATLGILVMARRLLPPGIVTLGALGVGAYVVFLGLMALSSSGRATLRDGLTHTLAKLPSRR